MLISLTSLISENIDNTESCFYAAVASVIWL
jgi:hypothetical protein